ncbi:MAG: S-layer homology domain-containing protein [Herbinix sp.]|nr:S-layer homology domain-containing protein [Herbinix sp.]
MKNKQIIAALITALLVTFIPINVSAGANEPSSWAKEEVREAIEKGIVPERLQTKYQQTITREEIASLFVQTIFSSSTAVLAKYEHDIPTRELFLQQVKVLDFNFVDTQSEDIKIAYAMGLINGTSETTFEPDRAVTRQEAAVMIGNVRWVIHPQSEKEWEEVIRDIDSCASWAREQVLACFASHLVYGTTGVIPGTGMPYETTFEPEGNFTREQAIIVALRWFNDHTANIKIRRVLPFGSIITRLNIEVTRDTVTAVKFREGYGIYPDDDVVTAWKKYSISKIYPITTMEQLAAIQNPLCISKGWFSVEMIQCAGQNINATFDLGYAEYEMLNKDFIFRYTIKARNKMFTRTTYNGIASTPLPFTRLK